MTGDTADGSPDLTVVIVAYQVRELVAACLASIEANSGGLAIETHLIENGDDGTAAMVRERFPRVIVHDPGKNLGFPAGNNLVIAPIAAGGPSGRYVLLLNPDTVVPAGTLEAMVAFMDEHPRAGLATCRVDLTSGGIDWASHRGFPTPWRAFTHYSGLERLFPRSRRFGGYHMTWEDLDSTHEIDTPTGAFFLVRTEAVREVGPLDETFFMYGEDIDWAYRIKHAGWKVYYHPSVHILHHKGASSGLKRASAAVTSADTGRRLRSNAHFTHAMRVFYDKHFAAQDPLPLRLLVRGGIGARSLLVRARIHAAARLRR